MTTLNPGGPLLARDLWVALRDALLAGKMVGGHIGSSFRSDRSDLDGAARTGPAIQIVNQVSATIRANRYEAGNAPLIPIKLWI